MNARVLACLSGVALAVVAYGATPETTSIPNGAWYDSMELTSGCLVKHEPPDLRAKVDMTCSDLPLRDLLSSLAKQAEVTVFLDEREIANTQAAFDRPMAVEISDKITLYSALALALEPQGLAYYTKDGKVVVTNQSFVVSTESLTDRPDRE